MRGITIALVSALSLSAVTCDEEQECFAPHDELSDVTPRAVDVLYLVQTAPGAVDLGGFAKLVAECSGAADPLPPLKIAVTWSLEPLGSGKPSVLGLGTSLAVPPDRASIPECYRKLMLSLGATPLP